MLVGYVAVGENTDTLTFDKLEVGNAFSSKSFDSSDVNKDSDFNFTPTRANRLKVKGELDTFIDRRAKFSMGLSPRQRRFPRIQRIVQAVQVVTDENGKFEGQAALPPVGRMRNPEIKIVTKS